MKEIKRRMEYDTPKVELFEARVERGFAGSSNELQPTPTQSNTNEAYGEGGTTGVTFS